MPIVRRREYRELIKTRERQDEMKQLWRLGATALLGAPGTERCGGVIMHHVSPAPVTPTGFLTQNSILPCQKAANKVRLSKSDIDHEVTFPISE